MIGAGRKTLDSACARCPKEQTFEQEDITKMLVLLKSAGDFYILGSKLAGSSFHLGPMFPIAGRYLTPDLTCTLYPISTVHFIGSGNNRKMTIMIRNDNRK